MSHGLLTGGRSLASLTPSSVRPDASSTELVKMQTSGAGKFYGLSIDAVEEDVADRCVWVSEEAVLTRTLFVGLWWL